MSFEYEGSTIETDENGYLVSLEDWAEGVAGKLAEDEEINMNDQHWEIINFLRDYYWKNYGTTLSGMMQEHKIDPLPYLYEVHDIPLDSLTVDPLLVKEINKLNGEKIVYTNGSKFHANRVLNARGLTDCFHQIYGIEDANYVPKPEEGAYKQIIKLADVNPLSAVMFEDEPKNLEVPHKMGMQTVLITDEEIVESRHHITNNLTNFLLKIVSKVPP